MGTLEVEGEGTEQTAGLSTRYVWRTGSADTGSFGLLMVAGDHDNDPTTLPRAYFTGYDGRGNLTSLAENRQGVAAAAWEYSPFGEVLRAEGSAELPHLVSLGATFGFSTQYTDAETGLVYFGHRYYHPGMGRFLNKDPLGEAGGLNRYAYALNDPVNLTDYRGLCYSGPVDSLGYRYFASFSDGLIMGSAPEHDTFNRPNGGGTLPYEVIRRDANGNALVAVTDREAFDAMVRDWESANPGKMGVVPRDQWELTGEFDVGGNFHLTGFTIKAPWEGGTSWLSQGNDAISPARMPRGIVDDAGVGESQYLSQDKREQILVKAWGNLIDRDEKYLKYFYMAVFKDLEVRTNSLSTVNNKAYPEVVHRHEVDNGIIVIDLTINKNTSTEFVESMLVHGFVHVDQHVTGLRLYNEYDAYRAQWEYEKTYHRSVLSIFHPLVDKSTGQFVSEAVFNQIHLPRTGQQPNAPVVVNRNQRNVVR